MGKATIVGGGDKGNYTIKMDYGTATRDATVAAIAQRLTELATKITEAQTKLDAAKAAEAEKKTAAQKATNDYIAATQAIPKAFEDVSSAMDAVENLAASATATPEERKAAQDALTAAEAAYTAAQDAAKEALSEQTKAATALVEAKKKTAPLQLALDLLEEEQKQLQKDKSYWEGLQLENTLQAWCADYTENGSGEVATMEIPGENQIVLIKPGAPAGNTVDGKLVAREVQSPEQVFFNAAILPGWQKFKPTYRSGVITALNTSNNTASVTLDAAQSSAAGLDINKMTALANVPVVYMTCHASAFEVGDRCVVRFDGMDWEQPQVVGFVDNPKPCLPEIRVSVYVNPFVSQSAGTRKFLNVIAFGPVGPGGSQLYGEYLEGDGGPESYKYFPVDTGYQEVKAVFFDAVGGFSQQYTVNVTPAVLKRYDSTFVASGNPGYTSPVGDAGEQNVITSATSNGVILERRTGTVLTGTYCTDPAIKPETPVVCDSGPFQVAVDFESITGQGGPMPWPAFLDFAGIAKPVVTLGMDGKIYLYQFDRHDPVNKNLLIYKYKPGA